MHRLHKLGLVAKIHPECPLLGKHYKVNPDYNLCTSRNWCSMTICFHWDLVTPFDDLIMSETILIILFSMGGTHPLVEHHQGARTSLLIGVPLDTIEVDSMLLRVQSSNSFAGRIGLSCLNQSYIICWAFVNCQHFRHIYHLSVNSDVPVN